MTEILTCPEGKIGTAIVQNGVTEVGSHVFYKCGKLEEIQIPESVTSIEAASFEAAIFPGCSSLVNISLAANNSVYASKDGMLYDKDVQELLRCPEGKAGKITMNKKATVIGEGAFFQCKLITDIVIPASVREIRDKAFIGCSSLEAISVEDGNKVYASEDGIFKIQGAM